MKKILVIDDDEQFCLATVTALRKHGYEVLPADGGAAGLAVAMDQRPDLVLCDVNMAGQDGFAVLKHLRAQPETAAIPVILMTGQPQQTDARFSMNQGADDYLAKPFSMEQMLVTVRLRLRRQEGISQTVDRQYQAERLSAVEKIRLQTSALEAAANGIAIVHRNGNILWINPAFTKLTGYNAEEVVGRTPRLLKSGQHPPEFYNHMWATITAGKVWQGELVNRRKDGSLYDEEMMITPVCGADGKIQNFIAIKQDVSERKRFEVQMERLRTEHAVILNGIGEGVHWIDKTGRIKYENPAAAQMLGYEVAELIGQPAHATMHHSRPDGTAYPQAECHIYATLRDGVVRHVNDEVFWRKDGTSFPVEYVCTPIYEKDGSFGGSVVIFKDTTQRKRLEMQLLQFQKLESIGQLAAGIAHEINTPTQYVGDNTRFVKDSFAAILGVLHSHKALLAAARAGAVTPELLAHSEAVLAGSDLAYLCEQIPAALKETLEGVERVSKIVRAMKEFSNPGGKEKTPADLNRAVESTVTVAHNEWKYVADVKLELAPELPLVPCFIGEFNQCILNLLVNAAHAIGDVVKSQPGVKGLITVQTRRVGDHAEVRVADTGTGIPQASQPKIFEPFFTTKDVGRGTGQGLSIVYGSIVRRHGGTVTFETEIGRGTTFIIKLPLKTKIMPAPSPPPGFTP